MNKSKEENIIRGKKGKASGADFEKRTRAFLIEEGWIVSKFPNKVVDEKLIPAKHVFRGKGIPMALGTGFPDFVAYKQIRIGSTLMFDVVFVECKVNKTLKREEKEMAKWYLKHEYCSAFFVAFKTKEKNRIKVNLQDFRSIKDV